jgi:hypothetical protein
MDSPALRIRNTPGPRGPGIEDVALSASHARAGAWISLRRLSAFSGLEPGPALTSELTHCFVAFQLGMIALARTAATWSTPNHRDRSDRTIERSP